MIIKLMRKIEYLFGYGLAIPVGSVIGAVDAVRSMLEKNRA
jgi:hypothetical protein